MTLDGLEGRERHVLMKALSIAIRAIDSTPERKRPSSDRDDMAAMLDKLAPNDLELEMYMRAADWNLSGQVPNDSARG